jgi:thioredoxin:protein disulfide reductase
MRQIQNVLGIALLGVAIWMLSRILNPSISLILWAAWAIGIAIYLKAFSTPIRKIQLISKGIGILIFVYSILLLTGALMGSTDPLKPISIARMYCKSTALNFITVKTAADIQKQMALAPGKPVFLDFYAQWCVSCKYLENHVLTNPLVQNQLQRFLLLRADITADDDQDRALMRQYGVVAPPTFVVFNSQHTESPIASSVGEVSAQQLAQKLVSVK